MRKSSSFVFDQLKEILGISTDRELAETLGVWPESISRMRQRNTLPYESILPLIRKKKLTKTTQQRILEMIGY